MTPRLTVIAASIRAMVVSAIDKGDPYWSNVGLNVRMETLDPHLSKVVLGLHMDGADASTTFVDVTGKTVTAVGNAQIDTAQSKFGGASGLFDGTGDYLTVPSSTDFDLGISDFTIECGFRTTQTTANATLINREWQGDYTGGYTLMLNGSTQFPTFYCADYSTGSPLLVSNTAGHLDGNWHHLAVTRVGNAWKMFLDGIVVSSATSGASIATVSKPITIGNDLTFDGGARCFNGRIDDVRITKGVGRYTGDFSLPTSAFPSELPVDDTGKVLTISGNTKLSTIQKRYGLSSCYFDGNGDFISAPQSPDFDFGTGDFTVECFVYLLSMPNSDGWPSYFANHFVALSHGVPGSGSGYGLVIGATKLMWNNNDPQVAAGNHGITIGTWCHIAATRKDGVVRTFANGVKVGEAPGITTNYAYAQPFWIGCETGETSWLNGYIDDVRVTKGIARYTSDFVPKAISSGPESGDPYWNYTSLLLKMEGADSSTTFTDSSYSPKTVSVFGNTQLKTSQFRYGVSSGYFDGTGDTITVPNTASIVGTENYTVEFWIRPSAFGFSNIIANDTGSGFACSLTPSGNIDWGRSLIATDGTGLSSIPLNVWSHVAMVQNGGNFKLFIDGVLDTSVAWNPSFAQGVIRIGSDGNATGRFLNGYLDDVRITKGVARYTTNFIPPGNALANAPAVTDPWWPNVVLAMHMDGANNSTVFNDLKGNTFTVSGTPTISTTQSKFGGSSLSLPQSSWIRSLSGLGILATDDYTLEFWFYATEYPNDSLMVASDTGSSGSTITLMIHNSKLCYGYYNDGPTTVTLNAWHHAAVSRVSGVSKWFLDGVIQGTVTDTSRVFTSPLLIGGDARYGGYIDDLRITKGVGRYGADFTPPAAAFVTN